MEEQALEMESRDVDELPPWRADRAERSQLLGGQLPGGQPTLTGQLPGQQNGGQVSGSQADDQAPLPDGLPTVGSTGHGDGSCKPCAFVWKEEGCNAGITCLFCHVCDVGEKKRRRKKKLALRKAIGHVDGELSPRRSASVPRRRAARPPGARSGWQANAIGAAGSTNGAWLEQVYNAANDATYLAPGIGYASNNGGGYAMNNAGSYATEEYYGTNEAYTPFVPDNSGYYVQGQMPQTVNTGHSDAWQPEVPVSWMAMGSDNTYAM